MKKKPYALYNLTPDLYLKYKKRKISDREIAKLFKTTYKKVNEWKKNNGFGYVDFRRKDVFYRYFPDVLEREKKKYLSLYEKGWDLYSIASELNMSPSAVSKFREVHFPEHIMYRHPRFLTAEQRQTALKNGIEIFNVYDRISRGWSVEQAITIKTGMNPRKNGKFISKLEVTQ
ncbi:MAG TPA: hypothetical protein VFH42_06410 [Sporolactobacillaceae bacterium]|nr:hypothetical protein [Sporolactobacillaceae bacterium]